jgi:hypothetical protein
LTARENLPDEVLGVVREGAQLVCAGECDDIDISRRSLRRSVGAVDPLDPGDAVRLGSRSKLEEAVPDKPTCRISRERIDEELREALFVARVNTLRQEPTMVELDRQVSPRAATAPCPTLRRDTTATHEFPHDVSLPIHL